MLCCHLTQGRHRSNMVLLATAILTEWLGREALHKVLPLLLGI